MGKYPTLQSLVLLGWLSVTIVYSSSAQRGANNSSKIEFTNTAMGEVTDEDGIWLGFTSFRSSDGIASTIYYRDFGSPAEAQAYLERQIAKAKKLIGRGEKVGTNGQAVGMRAEVLVRSDARKKASPIWSSVLWTDGVKFHQIYSLSRENMLDLEKVYRY
jgi:hypothetical protein